MMMKVFAVYDTKALCYATPFFMGSAGTAIRAFSDLVNDNQSSVSKHPTDYILFEIGEFDDQTAKLVSLKEPRNLGLASDFLPVRTASAARSVVVENGVEVVR